MTQPWQTHNEDAQPGNPGAPEIPVVETPLERPKPRGNNAFVLLLLVFCAALAVIYVIGMRKPKAAVAADIETERKFDTALASLAQRSGKSDLNKSANADQIVQMFYNTPKSSQIKAEDLPGNPFDLEIPDVPKTEPRMTKTGGQVSDNRGTPAGESGAPQFKLQSIIVSRQMPAAMINNKLCTIGSRLGEWEVTDIDASRVILASKDRTMELKMERPILKSENAE